MNCKFCDKSFTGLACFQQHEASEKHKKKVILFQMRSANGIPQTPATFASSNDSQVIHCDTCEVNFIGLLNFQKHVNSLQHVEMFKKKNECSAAEDQLDCIPAESKNALAKEINPGSSMPLNFPNLMPGVFAKCDACNMQFSGPEPYQQHLASEKHKKKSIRKQLFSNRLTFDTVDSDKIMPFVKTEGNTSKNVASGTAEPFAECPICVMQFSGPEPYQLHVDSVGHQEKVAMQLNSSMPSLRNNSNGFSDKIMPFVKPEGTNTSKNDASGTAEPFAECPICNMHFSGPEPYQLHIDSAGHQKKVAIQLNSSMPSLGNNSNGLSHYRCNVCDNDFTGPIPYDDHMNSKGHKKKVQNVEFLNNIRSIRALQSDSTQQVTDNLMEHINSDSPVVNRGWYCEVCKKQSSGPIPHEAHLASEGHRKKVIALEMEQKLKIARESLIQNHLNTQLKKECLNEEDQISLSTNNNNNANEVSKDFYISKDLILCDALKNIGVIPKEDINVTIFYPEDKIVFA